MTDFTKNDLPGLDADGAATLTGTVSVGVSWDVSSRGTGGLLGRLSRKMGADLDAVAVLFQDGDPVVLVAGFDDNLMDPLKDGSIVHSGDNTTGRGDGDDETITLHLDRIPGEFEKIVIMCASFKNKGRGDQGFQGANNVIFTTYDGTGPDATPEFTIRPSLLGRENCAIVTVLKRQPDGAWGMTKNKAKVSVRHGDQSALIRAAVNA